jgi:hypothetical protein
VVMEAQVEARWQARLQGEEDAKSAAAKSASRWRCHPLRSGEWWHADEVEMRVCGLWRKLCG